MNDMFTEQMYELYIVFFFFRDAVVTWRSLQNNTHSSTVGVKL